MYVKVAYYAFLAILSGLRLVTLFSNSISLELNSVRGFPSKRCMYSWNRIKLVYFHW